MVVKRVDHKWIIIESLPVGRLSPRRRFPHWGAHVRLWQLAPPVRARWGSLLLMVTDESRGPSGRTEHLSPAHHLLHTHSICSPNVTDSALRRPATHARNPLANQKKSPKISLIFRSPSKCSARNGQNHHLSLAPSSCDHFSARRTLMRF